MKTAGPGVKEIRVRDSTRAYRVIYLATPPEAVYVLHCFQKKAQKTRKMISNWLHAASLRWEIRIMRKRNIQYSTYDPRQPQCVPLFGVR